MSIVTEQSSLGVRISIAVNTYPYEKNDYLFGWRGLAQ
jgi:hypothetical protein